MTVARLPILLLMILILLMIFPPNRRCSQDQE